MIVLIEPDTLLAYRCITVLLSRSANFLYSHVPALQ